MTTNTLGPVLVSCSHLTQVMIFFRLLEVKSSPLFFTRSCQQVVKHMVVPKERGETAQFRAGQGWIGWPLGVEGDTLKSKVEN